MTREGIASAVRPVLEDLGARRAILFGSYARGTQDRRSDIDVLIVDDRGGPYLDRIDRYFKPLSRVLDRPIEILVYTSEELQNACDRPFIARLLEEGVELYERGEVPTRS
jgi:predicted nucleotidyltransferase